MCVCVCVCVCMCMYVSVYMCLDLRVFMSTYVIVRVYLCNVPALMLSTLACLVLSFES